MATRPHRAEQGSARCFCLAVGLALLGGCGTHRPDNGSVGATAPDQLPPPPPPPPEPSVDAFGVHFPPTFKLVKQTVDVVVVETHAPRSEVLALVRESVTGGTTETAPGMTALDRTFLAADAGSPRMPLRIELREVSDGVTRVTVFDNP